MVRNKFFSCCFLSSNLSLNWRGNKFGGLYNEDLAWMKCFPFSALTLVGWLTGRASVRSVKDWVLVCWWWYFDRSFAHLITPVVTTTSITLSSNKSQNGDILVPANKGPPGKWPLEWRGKCYHIRCLILFTLTVSFVIKPPLHFFMLSQFQNVAWRICSYCWCCHHHFRLSFTSLFFTRLVEVWSLWNVDMEKNG